MQFEVCDFFGAERFYRTEGRLEWLEIEDVISRMDLQLQPSGQNGLQGQAIFDPKATNRILTEEAAKYGWSKIPVPESLRAFGSDWDAGKNAVLAEWQFSNYPFLWNNIIRSQVVAGNGWELQGLHSAPRAMIVVTKSGSLPASQSTLYFEQAKAQMESVFSALDLNLAIRLVGLTIPVGIETIQASWNVYSGRTSRNVVSLETKHFHVTWRNRVRVGGAIASITPVS
ncbi:PDDEXK family nuclease [Streptomyces harbinensis]|uniref:hypothetical protein n=1 Tax=Streptomyces harbinensis TaxID=1176198 RepID=UPI001114B5FC|nr:hypothetical protein [Streptomyces harbinensis]